MLTGYIIAGKIALDERVASGGRIAATLMAFMLLGSIFYLAAGKQLVLPVGS
ncbi:MAG: hypothetical protein V2I38_15390 [Alcanivoracaceae bacterium]|nr:hypothetical protein [Alcanivoracaceae bacterium]